MSEQRESRGEIELPEVDYFRVIEERRRAAEGVLWQLPGISLAAQAFLLGAGLKPDAGRSAQIAVGWLGIVAVVATALIVQYQALRAKIFERWLAQTVRQPLRPDQLDPGESDSVENAYARFRVVWGVALFTFLVADMFVLGRGLALW